MTQGLLITNSPDRKNLIHVYLTVVVLENLGDCADGVFCWVDVLRLSAVCLVYHLERKYERKVKRDVTMCNVTTLTSHKGGRHWAAAAARPGPPHRPRTPQP